MPDAGISQLRCAGDTENSATRSKLAIREVLHSNPRSGEARGTLTLTRGEFAQTSHVESYEQIIRVVVIDKYPPCLELA